MNYGVSPSNCATVCFINLIHVNAKLPQVDLCQLNLLHQLLVRHGNIVERKDAPAETEEEQSTERNESPKGEL